VTTALAQHIADAQDSPLPSDVAHRAKQHLLDGLIAILSGSTLQAGRLAIAYAGSRGGPGESTIAGGPRTNTEMAAFANAISAHADETDDVNNRARVHPGSSVVPAAVAVAEAFDTSGSALLTAVSLGYDVTCAVNIGAWRAFTAMQRSPRTSHGLGQTFGAAAVAASLAGLPVEKNRHVLSYAAQQVAGISTFYRDPEHVGKAFTTSAMQAHSGVRAMELVRLGFTAIDDVFDGTPNVYDAFGEDGDGDRMLQELASTRHVFTTDMKQYPVGGPIQAAVEAVRRMLQSESFAADDVESIDVHLPTQGAYIVDNRDMPDISLQYILSVLLLDGRITFQNSHDYERHGSTTVRELMRRIHAVPDPTLDAADGPDLATRRTWRANVTLVTRDGRRFTERVDKCRGTADNPMSWDEVASKAHMALTDVMPKNQIDDLVQWVLNVDSAASARELRPFLEAPVVRDQPV
jgi:2-methylcitrate dehydratase PrpD